MSEKLVGCPVIECRQKQKNHHHKPSESVRFYGLVEMTQYICIHEGRYQCRQKHQNETGANGQQGGRLTETVPPKVKKEWVKIVNDNKNIPTGKVCPNTLVPLRTIK